MKVGLGKPKDQSGKENPGTKVSKAGTGKTEMEAALCKDPHEIMLSNNNGGIANKLVPMQSSLLFI